MINLFTSYFIAGSKERQNELNTCLQKNIDNPLINKICLILEQPIVNPLAIHDKVKWCLIKGRPTFNVFFEFIESNAAEINIIANSDIYFDGSLSELKKYSPNDVLALTRWDVLKDKIEFMNRWDSQDAWVIKGKVKNVNGDFELGKAGCDNAIADRFKKAGYNVINPSKTIKSYHLHLTGERTYNPNNRVPRPYLLLNPTT